MINLFTKYGQCSGVAEFLIGKYSEHIVLDEEDVFGVIGFICKAISEKMDIELDFTDVV